MIIDGAPIAAPQSLLLEAAIAYANTHRASHQDEVMAYLQREFPHQPTERHYLNPAAEAVMRRVTKEQHGRKGLEKDIAKLRAEGKPEGWAYTQRGLPLPEVVEADPERENNEPSPADLAAISRGRELVGLCAMHDIYFLLHEDGGLKLSRQIVKDGALHRAMQPFKAGILAGLKGQPDDAN